MQRIASGVIDQVVYFFAQPGLSSHTVDRARNATSFTAMTTPTVTELADGIYSLLLDEDMTITGGNLTEAMVFMVKAPGMTNTPIYIELFDPTEYTVGTVTVNTDMRGTDTAATAAQATDIQGRLPAALSNGAIDANTARMNDVAVIGAGTGGNLWRA